jgi:hypothetical protein
MPYVCQSQTFQPNSSADFIFPNQVTQYLAGVASFQFSYGVIDHKVQQFGLSLASTSSYDSTANQSTVRVTATGILSDASGNTLNADASYVTVSVLAWTGIANPDLVLSASYTAASGGQSSNINLPGSLLPLLNAGLSGFNLNYGSDDYHVGSIMAQVAPGQNGSQGFLTAQAYMRDASGDQAQNPTASGVLLANTATNSGLVIQPYTRQDVGEQNIPMGVPLSSAMALLTGFQVQFPDGDDHHVLKIGAGPDACYVNPNDSTRVLTSGVWAWMSDQHQTGQDNTKSSASILVIGIP